MTHHTEKLKSLEGNLKLMQLLWADMETDHTLKHQLKERINVRLVEIEAQKETIAKYGKLVPATERPFFETHPTDFEIINQDL